MRKFIVVKAQYLVIVYEMGHSMGLRYNFISLVDLFFYCFQYW
jgi:hypothetical protein